MASVLPHSANDANTAPVGSGRRRVLPAHTPRLVNMKVKMARARRMR
jgi:hypothetical protein